MVVWGLILLYIALIFSVAGYFIDRAFLSDGVRCNDPVVVTGPNYGISTQTCDG